MWKRLSLAVLTVLLVTEIVVAAPYIQHALSDLYRSDVGWLGVAVWAELISMGAFARVQRRMLSAGGAQLRTWRMTALTYAASALSMTLPGGKALSVGYVFKRLRSWGATVPAAGFTLLACALLSTLSFAVLAVVGAVAAGGGGIGSILVLAAAALAAVAAVVVRRRRRPDLLARTAGRVLVRANRLARRSPDAGLAWLQRLAGDLAAIRPRRRDWLAAFALAELNWLADLACLLACCKAVGADGASVALVLVAYIAGMSAASLSLLPGGIGTTDAAMIFALTQGGDGVVSATAAVMLFRLISFAMVVTLGWVFWGATWNAERRRSVQVALPPSDLTSLRRISAAGRSRHDDGG
jgi:uncharacterized protein (TIRG00374 family)